MVRPFSKKKNLFWGWQSSLVPTLSLVSKMKTLFHNFKTFQWSHADAFSGTGNTWKVWVGGKESGHLIPFLFVAASSLWHVLAQLICVWSGASLVWQGRLSLIVVCGELYVGAAQSLAGHLPNLPKRPGLTRSLPHIFMRHTQCQRADSVPHWRRVPQWQPHQNFPHQAPAWSKSAQF